MGGIVALLLLIFGIVFLFRHSRRRPRVSSIPDTREFDGPLPVTTTWIDPFAHEPNQTQSLTVSQNPTSNVSSQMPNEHFVDSEAGLRDFSPTLLMSSSTQALPAAPLHPGKAFPPPPYAPSLPSPNVTDGSQRHSNHISVLTEVPGEGTRGADAIAEPETSHSGKPPLSDPPDYPRV